MHFACRTAVKIKALFLLSGKNTGNTCSIGCGMSENSLSRCLSYFSLCNGTDRVDKGYELNDSTQLHSAATTANRKCNVLSFKTTQHGATATTKW